MGLKLPIKDKNQFKLTLKISRYTFDVNIVL